MLFIFLLPQMLHGEDAHAGLGGGGGGGGGEKKKRHRRTHSELDRSIICPFPECGRCYASKHALHLHMKNKHGWVGKKGAQAAAAAAAVAATETGAGAANTGSVDELNGIRTLFKGPKEESGALPGGVLAQVRRLPPLWRRRYYGSRCMARPVV